MILVSTRTQYDSGGVLLSHTIPRAVPSALEGLTTGFGMGPGVSLPPRPPEKLWGQSGLAQPPRGGWEPYSGCDHHNSSWT